MKNVKIYLKSGNIIQFRAEEFFFTERSNELTGYYIANSSIGEMYFDCSSIEAIVYK